MSANEKYTCTVNTDSKYVISNLPCIYDTLASRPRMRSCIGGSVRAGSPLSWIHPLKKEDNMQIQKALVLGMARSVAAAARLLLARGCEVTNSGRNTSCQTNPFLRV